MHTRISIAILTAFTLACGDDSGPRVDLDMDDDTLFTDAEPTLAEGDVFATLTENGAVKLGLTEERVYFEVSQAVRERVDSEIATGMEESDSRIARSIGSAVRRGVAKALDIEIELHVDEIRDVDYRDGELFFEFEDPEDGDALENVKIDDEPLTRSFTEEDARAFVAAFRRVKSGEGRGTEEVDRPADRDAGTTESGAGGSF